MNKLQELWNGMLAGFRQTPAADVAQPDRRGDSREYEDDELDVPRGRGFGTRFDNDPAAEQMFGNYLGPADNPHPTLLYQIDKRGAGYQDEAISLLVETYEKDPYIMGLVKSRVANVLQFDSSINQYDDTEAGLEASLLIDRFVELAGWDRVQEEALEKSLGLGVSVHEMVWEQPEFPLGKRRRREESSRDRVRKWDLPLKFRQVAPERIAFDPQGRLLLRCLFKTEEEARAAGFTKSQYDEWWYPHPLKVLIFNRFEDYDNPYGYPLLATLFMKAWLKRQQDIAWAQYNDRSTGPFTEAYYTDKDALPMGNEDRQKVFTMVTNMLRHAGAVMPPGVRIALHELSAMSSQISYSEMIRSINEHIAVLLVGQPSTSTTSRQGTQAQSDVHERNAHALYATDAAALERFSNKLFRLIILFNLPAAKWRCPRLNITTKSWAEVAKIINEVMKPGVEMNARIPEREYFRVTGFDEPLPGDRLLEIKPKEAAAPSQQRPAKTRARQGQRDRKRDPQGGKQQRDNKVN